MNLSYFISMIEQNVTDHRRTSFGNFIYPHTLIISIVSLAILCGRKTFIGFADWGKQHIDDLKEFFHLPHGTPAVDTIRRFLEAADVRQFPSACTCAWN